MAGAFLIWCRLVGWAAPLAAGFFVLGWMPLFYGSEVSPNLYVAFVAVALLGMSVRFARSADRGLLLAVAALAALAALFRPSDAVVLSVAVTVVVAIIEIGAVGAFAVAAFGGLAIGMAPWVLESWVRMDGPVGSFADGQRQRPGRRHGERRRLPAFAGWSADGSPVGQSAPRRGRRLDRWVAGVGGCGGRGWRGRQPPGFGSGALRGHRPGLRPMSWPPVCSPLGLLLPAFALVCVAAGIGGVALLGRVSVRAMAVVPLLVVLVGGAAWNLPVAVEIGDAQTEDARSPVPSVTSCRSGRRKTVHLQQPVQLPTDLGEFRLSWWALGLR